jgi:hypothetical protein
MMWRIIAKVLASANGASAAMPQSAMPHIADKLVYEAGSINLIVPNVCNWDDAIALGTGAPAHALAMPNVPLHGPARQ